MRPGGFFDDFHADHFFCHARKERRSYAYAAVHIVNDGRVLPLDDFQSVLVNFAANGSVRLEKAVRPEAEFYAQHFAFDKLLAIEMLNVADNRFVGFFGVDVFKQADLRKPLFKFFIQILRARQAFRPYDRQKQLPVQIPCHGKAQRPRAETRNVYADVVVFDPEPKRFHQIRKNRLVHQALRHVGYLFGFVVDEPDVQFAVRFFKRQGYFVSEALFSGRVPNLRSERKQPSSDVIGFESKLVFQADGHKIRRNCRSICI